MRFPAGVVVAGGNLIAVDLTCAKLMGFDYMQLPILYKSLIDDPLPLLACNYNDVICKSNNQQFSRALFEFNNTSLDFTPHFGWKNHIEIEK